MYEDDTRSKSQRAREYRYSLFMGKYERGELTVFDVARKLRMSKGFRSWLVNASGIDYVLEVETLCEIGNVGIKQSYF